MAYITEKGIIYTGMEARCDIKINVDTEQFDFDPGAGQVVTRASPHSIQAPMIERVPWAAITGVPATYLALASGTWLGFNKSLKAPPYGPENIVQQVADFDREQLEYILRVGRISHFARTAITGTFDYPKMYDLPNDDAYRQMLLGTTKISGGKIEAAGTDLSLKRSAIITSRIGAGTVDAINFPENVALDPFPMLYAYRDTTAGATVIVGPPGTQIDPEFYNPAPGSLIAVPNVKWSIKYDYFFPNVGAETVFQGYGQGWYENATAALNAMGNDFDIQVDIAGGIILAGIAIKQGITNLTQAIADGNAFIRQASKFGEF